MNDTRRPHDYADLRGIETGEMDGDELRVLVACLLGWVGLTVLASGVGAALLAGIRWLREVLG